MSSNRNNVVVTLIVAMITAIAVIIAGALQGQYFPQPPSPDTPEVSIRQANLPLSTVPRTIHLYPVNDKDFVAEAHLLFSPTNDFEGAGFYVELAQDGRIEFVLAYCTSNNIDCVGRGLYLDVLKAFSFEPTDLTVNEVIDFSGNEVYLRLEKSGEEYNTSYRNPSNSPSNGWITLATFQDRRDVLNVGIVAQTNWPSTRDDRGNNPSDLPSLQARFIEFLLTSTS